MIQPRKSVEVFAVEMERRLRRNDYKGGWLDEHLDYLIERLEEEVEELKRASRRYGSKRNDRSVIMEAADVANFAMMLADRRQR